MRSLETASRRRRVRAGRAGRGGGLPLRGPSHGCPQCAAQVTEFGPATRQLMLYRQRDTARRAPLRRPRPADARPAARRGGRPAPGRSAGAGCSRWPPPWSSPWAAPRVADHGAAAAGRGTGHASPRPTRKSGVWAEVTVRGRGLGQPDRAEGQGRGRRPACQLVVIGKDGSEETAASWKSPEGADEGLTDDGRHRHAAREDQPLRGAHARRASFWRPSRPRPGAESVRRTGPPDRRDRSASRLVRTFNGCGSWRTRSRAASRAPDLTAALLQQP